MGRTSALLAVLVLAIMGVAGSSPESGDETQSNHWDTYQARNEPLCPLC